jgi:ubiquitin carboxyl-terminal hydrolase 7
MTAKVGEKLQVDPTHLRFHTVNASTGNPKSAVKRHPTQTLQQILMPPYSTFGNNNQRADMLYFEVLDMSLSELDTKKNLKVTWLSDGITKEVSNNEFEYKYKSNLLHRNSLMSLFRRMELLQTSSLD